MKAWWANVTAGVISGLVSGVVGAVIVALFLALRADDITDRALAANPTCASPAGLRPISGQEVTATGASFTGPDGFVYKAEKAVDGYGGTMWIPPLGADPNKHPIPVFDTANDSNVLTLRLSSAQPVELVCVVNGLGNTYANYQNWGRVRTVEIWTTDPTHPRTTVLQSLGADTFPNAQFLARRLGVSSELHIRLVDAYAGLTQEFYDPDVCFEGAAKGVLASMHVPPNLVGQPRYADGCIRAPAPYAGIADVYLYTSSKS